MQNSIENHRLLRAIQINTWVRVVVDLIALLFIMALMQTTVVSIYELKDIQNEFSKTLEKSVEENEKIVKDLRTDLTKVDVFIGQLKSRGIDTKSLGK